MNQEQTLAVLQAYWGGDHSLVAEDAVFEDLTIGYAAEGRSAISRMVEEFYSEVFRVDFETAYLLVGDGRATLEGYVVGTQQRSYAGIEPTGRPVRMPICICYELADGLVRRARIYAASGALVR